MVMDEKKKENINNSENDKKIEDEETNILIFKLNVLGLVNIYSFCLRKKKPIIFTQGFT